MPRRMACSLTIDAVKARTKTVTRRHTHTWENLQPGDRLTLIEKGMGLAKGERQVVLAEVTVTANDIVALSDIDQADCDAEGFPHLTPAEFIDMWLRSHRIDPDRWGTITEMVHCRRIAWRYDCERCEDWSEPDGRGHRGPGAEVTVNTCPDCGLTHPPLRLVAGRCRECGRCCGKAGRCVRCAIGERYPKAVRDRT